MLEDILHEKETIIRVSATQLADLHRSPRQDVASKDGDYTLSIMEINRESRIKVQSGAFGLSRKIRWSEVGLQHATACKATRPSDSPDEIDEYAFVVVLQVGQFVGEVGEVVADAGLQVLANMTIDRGQRSAAPLTYIR
jgi:hypothetical protein